MRPMPDQTLEKYRALAPELELYGFTSSGTASGVFAVRHRGARLRIVASHDQGGGWEHVSVSLIGRCPTWDEMCFVKALFWLPHEAVMQLHPPESDWVNNHPYCLHLWRPTRESVPLPPSIYVGVKSYGALRNEEEARKMRREVLGSQHER